MWTTFSFHCEAAFNPVIILNGLRVKLCDLNKFCLWIAFTVWLWELNLLSRLAVTGFMYVLEAKGIFHLVIHVLVIKYVKSSVCTKEQFRLLDLDHYSVKQIISLEWQSCLFSSTPVNLWLSKSFFSTQNPIGTRPPARRKSDCSISFSVFFFPYRENNLVLVLQRQIDKTVSLMCGWDSLIVRLQTVLGTINGFMYKWKAMTRVTHSPFLAVKQATVDSPVKRSGRLGLESLD